LSKKDGSETQKIGTGEHGKGCRNCFARLRMRFGQQFYTLCITLGWRGEISTKEDEGVSVAIGRGGGSITKLPILARA